MKAFKRIFSLVIALGLIFCIGFSASAAGNVTYKGRADEFVFAPGSDESPTDLFENFKNVMPGDTLTQQIVIKNDAAEDIKVEIYLRPAGVDEASQELLDQIRVAIAPHEGTDFYEAPVSNALDLGDELDLGTVLHGGEITIDVTLTVPLTLSNDFADSLGVVTWEFTAEEIPDPPTGDNSHTWVYIVVAVCALGVIAALLIYGKKSKK